MPAPVLTYSPNDVKIVICGYTLTGILGVEFKYNNPPFTLHQGIRGVHTRVFNKDQSGVVTLEVQQTSVTNDILTQILTQDRLNKSARLDMSVQDTGGTTLWNTNQAYIPGYPSLKFSQGFENRIWTIDVLQLTDFVVGGNAGGGIDLFSSVSGALDVLSGASTAASDAIVNVINF